MYYQYAGLPFVRFITIVFRIQFGRVTKRNELYVRARDAENTYFFEHERLVPVHGIDAVVRDDARAELLADRVGRQPVHLDVHVGAGPLVGKRLPGYDVDGQRTGDDAVHGGLGERVERPVGPSHELRFQQVPGPQVVLEYAQVQLHGHVQSLVVERHQLAARVPEHLRHEVGRVEPGAGRVHAAQLVLVVLDELHRPLFQQRHRLFLVERRHLVMPVFLCAGRHCKIYFLSS